MSPNQSGIVVGIPPVDQSVGKHQLTRAAAIPCDCLQSWMLQCSAMAEAGRLLPHELVEACLESEDIFKMSCDGKGCACETKNRLHTLRLYLVPCILVL